MKKLFILVLSVFFTGLSQGQAPPLQAENSFGGSDIEHAFDIHQTNEGGFVMAGHTRSGDGQVIGNHGSGTFDVWIVKLSRKGKIQWEKPFGGRLDETAFSVQQTSDGGYIAAGESNSNDGQVTGNHGDLDFWILKLDRDGNMIWSKSLGGSKADFATCIKQTKEGGYIVCGGSYSNDDEVSGHHGSVLTPDYWIVKLDNVGMIQWENSYGGSRGDVPMSIIQSSDGGYVVAGNTNSTDGNVKGVHDSIYGDFWVIKLTSTGSLVWQKTLGGSDYEEATDIQQTKDGGFISCGWNRSPNDGDVTGNHGNYDFWVVKQDKSGNLLWQKSLGGTQPDLAYSIRQTIDNGYIVAGGTNSNDGEVSGLHGTEGKDDLWVVKLGVKGELLWQKTLGGTEFEEGRSVDQTTDGGYIIAGSSGWDHPDNGDVTGNHGDYDCWVVKLAPATTMISSPVVENSRVYKNFIPVFSPNPAHDYLDIGTGDPGKPHLITVMNMEGQTVIRKKTDMQTRHLFRLDISGLKSGTYFLVIETNNENLVRKFMKE